MALNKEKVEKERKGITTEKWQAPLRDIAGTSSFFSAKCGFSGCNKNGHNTFPRRGVQSKITIRRKNITDGEDIISGNSTACEA